MSTARERPSDRDLMLALIDRVERLLSVLGAQHDTKEWLSTKEVAALLGREEDTVRRWCWLGRVRARKLEGGRGNEGEWRISCEELERIRAEGLLKPVRPK